MCRPIMEADVCLVDHVQTTSIKHGHSGVNIREFEDSIINPDPVIQNEETEQLMEDYLSPQKLVQVNCMYMYNIYFQYSIFKIK